MSLAHDNPHAQLNDPLLCLRIPDAIFTPASPITPSGPITPQLHKVSSIKVRGFNKSHIHNLFIAIFHMLSGTDVYLIQNKPATDQGHPIMLDQWSSSKIPNACLSWKFPAQPFTPVPQPPLLPLSSGSNKHILYRVDLSTSTFYILHALLLCVHVVVV